MLSHVLVMFKSELFEWWRYLHGSNWPDCYPYSQVTITIREDSMIYRGPGFLAIIWIGSAPTPFPLSRQQVSLYLSLPVCSVELTDGRGGRGGHGAESYNSKKSWPSINRSILSDLYSYHLSGPWLAMNKKDKNPFWNTPECWKKCFLAQIVWKPNM